MKQIKILVITKSIDGGTGTFALSFKKITKHNNRIKLINLVLEKPSFRTLNSNEERMFAFLRKKNHYPSWYTLTPKNILSAFQEIMWAKKHVDIHKPDIVMGLDSHSNLLISFLKYVTNMNYKVVLGTRIDLLKTLEEKTSSTSLVILKKLIQYFYNKADELVCVSSGVADSLKNDFGLRKQPWVIYNGIDISNKSKNKQKRMSPKPRILSIGRLVNQKDFETLIYAFAQVEKKVSDVKLIIVGDGPKKAKLRKLCKTMGLEKKVTFTGWKNNLTTVMRSSDIFILSSKREGFGWVILEAMAHGLPVIVTNSPHGPSEIVENGIYGRMVEVGDSKNMAKDILELIHDKSEYSHFSKKSFERICFFNEKTMFNAYVRLFKNTLSI